MTTTEDRSAERATPSTTRIALVLGALIALGPLTIDLYLPALPRITTDLMTTQSAVQLTLTGTLLGLAIGQLVIGPYSDAVGRRKPLLFGTGLHLLASALIVVAPSIEVLGVLRVLQGIGSSAGAVVGMAIVRDLFQGRAAATLLSRLILVMGIAPVLAPTFGGVLLRVTSWRGVFAALAVYGLVLLPIVAKHLPETLPPSRRHSPGARTILRTSRVLLRDRAFVGLVFVAGLTMAGLFGYVSGGAFVYQQQFGLDQQQFGMLFGAGAVCLIGATQLNALLLRRYEPGQILGTAMLGGVAAAVVLLGCALTNFGGLLGIVIPLWMVLFACGLALPNAPALALSRHGESAGTAAALLGALQFGVGAVVSPFVGILGNDATAMATVMAATLALAVAILFLIVRPRQTEKADSATPSPLPPADDRDLVGV